MPAAYPGALPNLTESIPGTPSSTTLGTETAARTHSGHHAQIAEELGAALTELGTDPAGPDATVVARLDRMQGEIDAAEAKVVVNDYTTAGTHPWTKPSGAVWLDLLLIGGGAGGSSGGVQGAVNGASGGGGGAAGTIIRVRIPAADVSASGTLTVGAGGTGGAAVSTNTTLGAYGSAGGDSIFDGITALGGLAPAVSPQNGGLNRTGGASLSGDIVNSAPGANGGTGAAAGSAAAAQSRLIPTGGGGGGGKSNVGGTNAGGEGGDYSANLLGWPTSGAAGGAAPGGAGTAGTIFRGVGLGGGGGASGSGATNGGRGGDGAWPGGGGGGGGAAENGATSGRGGDGGEGRVTLIWYIA